MDVLNFINNDGQKLAPNPKYNSKTKKSGVSPTIKVDDLGYESDPRIDMAVNDLTNQSSISVKDARKYNEYGLNWNNWETNLDKQLADAQSNWAKAGGALFQTIISEIGLGTLKGFTDLGDFVCSSIFHITEDDYQNPASEKLQEWQDYINNELTPIYTDPDKNIKNGGFGDFGWWAKNVPQIASSLTLLFPAKGATTIASRVGKAAKVGKGVSATRRWVTGVRKTEDANHLNKLQIAINNPVNIAKANYGTKLVSEAMLMRTMENYQEARDTHQQTYLMANEKLDQMSDEEYKTWINNNKGLFDEDLDLSDKDKVAKVIAKKAADRTFSMDFSNAIFDVIQLHGLKNIGKGIKKATGRAVNEAHQASITAAGNYAKNVTTTAAANVIKKPFYKKAWNATKDFAKYNTLTALEESTEGIEEAVNYIAQQEGLTYGKALLAGKADDYRVTKGIASGLTLGIPNVISTYTNMQGQLADYLKSPELIESAFWGAIGGFVFAAGGNTLNRLELAKYEYNQRKKREKNNQTGEAVADNEGWLNLLELPENKAARIAIKTRQARLEQLATDLKNIQDGKNIFAPRDEQDNFVDFTGDIETQQAIARRKIEKQFRSDIAMDAMNSGTFELMLDYFQSNEVKQAMVKAGVATSENIDTYTEETIKDLNNVKDIYTKQSAHVLNQIATINADRSFKQTINLDYAKIIAKQNTDKVLAAQALDSQIKGVEILASEQEALTRETNPEVDLETSKRAIQLGSLIDMYGRLKAENRAILEKEAEHGHVDYRLKQQKRLNERQLDTVLKEIQDITVNFDTTQGFASLFAAVKQGMQYIKKEDGTFDIDQNFAATDEDIIKELDNLSLFGTTVGLKPSDESIIQVGNKLLQDINNSVSKNGLANINSKLTEHYITLEQLHLQKSINNSRIAGSISDIKSEIDFLHNGMNEARANMIKLAQDTVVKAIRQYAKVDTENAENIIDAIWQAYNQDKQQARAIAEKFMDKTNDNGKVTAVEFMDALDVFNFSNKTNEAVYDAINETIELARLSLLQEQETDNVDNNNTSNTNNQQNTSTNNNTTQPATQPNAPTQPNQPTQQPQNAPLNPSQGQQGSNLNNPSSDPQQTNTGQNNKQHQQDARQKLPSEDAIHLKPNGKVLNIHIKVNSNTGVITLEVTNKKTKNNIPAYENINGTYTLGLSTLSKQKQSVAIVTNHNLFGILGTDISDPEVEFEITKNPIVSFTNNKKNSVSIISSGELVFTKFNKSIEKLYQKIKQKLYSDDTLINGILDDIEAGNLNKVNNIIVNDFNVMPVFAKEVTKRLYHERFLGQNNTSANNINNTDNTTDNTNTNITNPKVDTTSPVESNEQQTDNTNDINNQTDNTDIQDNIQQDNTQQETNQSDNTSTGGVEQTSTNDNTNASTNNTNNINNTSNTISDFDEDSIKTRRTIQQVFGLYIPDIKADNINWDDVLSKVKQYLNDNAEKLGINKNELADENSATTKTITAIVNQLKKANEIIKSKKSALAKEGANLSFASKFEEFTTSNDNNFNIFFIRAAEAFMKEYKNILITPEVDGKQVVRLEDVLRICNNVEASSDNSVAAAMYDIVYRYLTSPIGKAKYLVVDLSKGRNVLNDVCKSNNDLATERKRTVTDFRIDTSTFLSGYTQEQQEEYYSVLDTLNEGDKLTLEIDTNHLLLKKGDVLVGRMAKPKIKGNKFVQNNEGWITEVWINDKGNIVSNLQSTFDYIFTNENPSCNRLRELFIKSIGLDENSDAYKKLIDNFKKESVITKLVEESRKDKVKDGSNKIFINEDGSIPYNMLFKHLSKLYNYTDNVATNSIEDTKDNIKTNLNIWFNKLYLSYNAINNVKQNTIVKISNINEGDINQVVDSIMKPMVISFEDNTIRTINVIDKEKYDKLPLVQEAVSDNYKCSVGICNDGIVQTDETQHPVSNWSNNSTILVVYSKNNTPDFVNAIGVMLDDTNSISNKNSIIGNLIESSTAILEETFQDYLNNKNFNINEVNDNILNVISNIVSINNDTSRISLFRPTSRFFKVLPITGKNGEQGITIQYINNGTTRFFRIYTKTQYSNNFGNDFGINDTGKKLSIYAGQKNQNTIAKEAANAFMDFIKETCNVNIDKTGIKNDSRKASTKNGFIKYENGKLKINIPSKNKTFVKEYNSYNDFLIEGNLIKVNTFIDSKGRNFSKNTNNQKANVNLTITLPTTNTNNTDNTSSLNTTNNDDNVTATDAYNSEKAKLNNVITNEINNNKTDVGIQIFRTILGDDFFNEFKRIADEFNILNDILPTRMMFDNQMNSKTNGHWNNPILVVNNDGKHPTYHVTINGNCVSRRIPINEKIVAGSRFLELASSDNIDIRKQAIRKLIHEQLHIKLNENPSLRNKVLKDIIDVYKECLSNVNNDLNVLDKNSENYKIATYIKRLLTAYNGERQLEEFLVESLTNKTLFDYLNNIKVENSSDNKKEDTLFTKIAKVIAKVFGWTIKDNSLYMKQLNILRDAINFNEENKIDETQNNVDEKNNTESSEKNDNENDNESNNKNNNEKDNILEDNLTEDDLLNDTDTEDDSALFSNFVENYTNEEDKKQILNIEAFKNNLYLNIQNTFDVLKNKGNFEISCI